MKRGSLTKKVEVEPSSLEQCLDKGLCSCCKEASTCTYPKVPDRPVLQCEEFNGILPPPSKRSSLIRNVSPVSPRGVVDEPVPKGLESLEPRGLCKHLRRTRDVHFSETRGGSLALRRVSMRRPSSTSPFSLKDKTYESRTR